MYKTITVLITLVFLSACSSVQTDNKVFPDDPAFAPVSAQSLQAPPNTNGSLFQARYTWAYTQTNRQQGSETSLPSFLMKSISPPSQQKPKRISRPVLRSLLPRFLVRFPA